MKLNLFVFISLFSILISSSTYCQNSTNEDKNIYVYQDNLVNHPDGTVGKLSFNIGGSYHSIKNQPGQPIIDAQSFQVGMGVVLTDKLSEHHSFSIYREFNSSYQLQIGLSYYFANPTLQNINLNPDGKLGTPILKLDLIHLMDNYKETKSKNNFQAEVVFPIANSFSIFGGFTKYEEITSNDNRETYGGVHLYLSTYPQGYAYENPDSPISSFALSLSAGKSKMGKFGKFEVLVPSSKSITIKISAVGNFLEAPRDKMYTGSAQLLYYTGK